MSDQASALAKDKAQDLLWKVQGNIKSYLNEPLRGFYVGKVVFVRIRPVPRLSTTLADVRLERRSITDPWMVDRRYLTETVFRAMKAQEVEVALPNRGVLTDLSGNLRGVYQGEVTLDVDVFGEVTRIKVKDPHVTRSRETDPWLIDQVRISRLLKRPVKSINVLFPF